MSATGYLKFLEVRNFKSYKGIQRIGPFKRFSCIIGPNGSGKSNLVDAISFVLGVKAARGSQLKDLIFRVDGEAESTQSAYVKLIYSENEKEIEFMRTITDKNESSFSMNGNPLSWDRFNKELIKFNIIVQAKNFLVYQGDVESIATKSPKALTQLFEEISGSIEYKQEYDKLLSMKLRAEEDTIFTEKKRKGISAEKLQFDQQMTEAEKYEKLVKRKKDTTVDYMLFQLYHIKQELTKHQRAFVAHRTKLEALQTSRLALNQTLGTKKSSQAKYRKDSMKIEQQIRKLKKEAEKQRPELIATKEEMTHIKKRLTIHSKAHANREHSLETHEQLLHDLQAKLADLQAEASSFEENIALEENEDIQLSPENLKEFNEKKQIVTCQTAKEISELDHLMREHRFDLQSKEACDTQMEDYTQRITQLEERNTQLQERMVHVKELKVNCQNKEKDLGNQLTDYQRHVKTAEKQKEKLVKQIEDIQGELRERKADMRESKRDQKLKELIKNLTRLFPSVRGRLIDLVEPRERYELAVTVTLGKNMDSIVVDDEKTAIECMGYMREQRLGTATFIPLDTIKVSPLNEQLRQIDSTVKLVVEVMKFDHSFKRAVHYACGNTVVCETMEDAKKIAFGTNKHLAAKVVTVDGVLIRKSGMITGGVSNSLVSRARGWEQKDIQTLKDKRDDLINQLADVGRTLRMKNKEEVIQNQITGLETRLTFIEKDLKMTKSKEKDTQEDIDNLRAKMNELKPTSKRMTSQINKRNKKIEALEEIIKEAENEVFGDFAERVGIDDIHEYEEKHIKLAKEKAQRRLDFSKEISKIENQLKYEQTRNLEESLASDAQKIKEDEEKISILEQRFNELKKVIDKAEARIATQNKSLLSLQSTTMEKDEAVSSVKKQIDDLMKKMTVVQKLFASAEGAIDQNRVRRHNIFQTCKVEEIWDLMPIDDEEDPMETDSQEDSQSEYAREDDIIISFRRVSSSLKLAANYDKHVQDFKNQLHSISMSIEEIDPNLKASIHLKRVKDRLGKTKDDLNAAREASRDADKKFKNVKKARIEKFNASYLPIAEQIDATYKALTSGRSGKPGGTAYLNVDNTEEPFLGGVRFHVMPPNKRFRDMEQLSGGEKTVAALALLFSMHSIHPAPFFLLDEVDAALDKSNIAKVARYLSSRKHDIQFIVVSLQDRFYENADSLIGVMFDQTQRCSATLSLSLDEYTR